MQEWISVEDRVPEENQGIVIVYDGAVWYGYYGNLTKKWSDDNFSSDMNVTHWMPFPDPPKD